MRRKKPKVVLHRGFNVIYDVILPQLKKKFGATGLQKVTEIGPKRILFVAKVGKQKYLFRLVGRVVHQVGFYPEDIEWEQLVELEKKDNLCPEALICLIQGIKFDPEAKIL